MNPENPNQPPSWTIPPPATPPKKTPVWVIVLLLALLVGYMGVNTVLFPRYMDTWVGTLKTVKPAPVRNPAMAPMPAPTLPAIGNNKPFVPG